MKHCTNGTDINLLFFCVLISINIYKSIFHDTNQDLLNLIIYSCIHCPQTKMTVMMQNQGSRSWFPGQAAGSYQYFYDPLIDIDISERKSPNMHYFVAKLRIVTIYMLLQRK